jgi:hypothetical protein
MPHEVFFGARPTFRMRCTLELNPPCCINDDKTDHKSVLRKHNHLDDDMNPGDLKRVVTKAVLKAQGYPTSFNLDKKDLIDQAFRGSYPAPASFADLGGIWNVDGAYTFYILRKYGAKAAFIVDTDFSDTAKRKSQAVGNLKLLQGNFGDKSVTAQLGRVDAILLFDVLLHQVKPDWNEVLEDLSTHTDCFIIFNQQWTGSGNTVRLLELGRDEYFRNVPHDKDHPTYKTFFEKLDEIHPQHQRPWRDIHNVWQWGITDGDLIQTLERLGYKMLYFKNCGRFGSLPNFENHAFVFQKKK